MNRVETIYSEDARPAAFARSYLDYVSSVLGKLDAEAIGRFIEIIMDARKRDAQIIFIGNGGSAATASHFANDIAIGPRCWDKPFRAVSLTDNMPIITAIANDHGYEHIFTLQLKTVMRPGDVVVAISASGNSPNVVRAVEYANEHGATTVALTGFDGGRLREVAQISVHVPTAKGEYGPVEDAHMVLDHLVGGFLCNLVRNSEAVEA
jgi:D-sedoheptulose 7-phosphate isomerase